MQPLNHKSKYRRKREREKREEGGSDGEPFLCHRVKLGLNERHRQAMSSVQDLWCGININLNSKQNCVEEGPVVSALAPEFKPAWMLSC